MTFVTLQGHYEQTASEVTHLLKSVLPLGANYQASIGTVSCKEARD